MKRLRDRIERACTYMAIGCFVLAPLLAGIAYRIFF